MKKTEFKYDSSVIKKEHAFLVIIRDSSEPTAFSTFREAELVSLVKTMGMTVSQTEIVTIRSPKAAFLIGTGKMQEICEQSDELDVDCIIFDADISPSQQRNWEKSSERCVIDRREVILQIFADRASTREAVLQVSLARQEYSLPRLTRAWTHLSRQRGGSKGTRGEGETQLEVDRRIVMNHISQIKRELKKVREHRNTQRKQRQGIPVPSGSIVGYTNAGKSSLLKMLTNADILVEDKLFATLDPTTRRIHLPSGTDVLLTDTVGFVQNLPHDLIDAFRSTLEETKFSDFIIHIVDGSHPEPMTCFKTTMEVLESVGCADKPQILVVNKMDLCVDIFHLSGLKNLGIPVVQLSVKEGTGIDELMQAITDTLFSIYPEETYHLPHDRYDLLAFIKKNGHVSKETYHDEKIVIKARIPERFHSVVKQFKV